jgi:hypothetical protein
VPLPILAVRQWPSWRDDFALVFGRRRLPKGERVGVREVAVLDAFPTSLAAKTVRRVIRENYLARR